MYFAKAKAYYDEKIALAEQVFDLGKKSIEITSIEAPGFRLGFINKLSISVRNLWNERLSDLYFNVDIGKGGSFITENLRTINKDVEPLATESFEVFWDTASVEPGVYDLKIKTTLDGEPYEKTAQVMVDADGMGLLEQGLAGYSISEGKGIPSGAVIYVVVVMLVIANVYLFIYIRKKLKSR